MALVRGLILTTALLAPNAPAIGAVPARCSFAKASYSLASNPRIIASFATSKADSGGTRYPILKIVGIPGAPAYYFRIEIGNGTANISLISLASNPEREGWTPPDPDSRTGRIFKDTTLLLIRQNGSFSYELPQPTGRAAAQIILPQLQEILWYEGANPNGLRFSLRNAIFYRRSCG